MEKKKGLKHSFYKSSALETVLADFLTSFLTWSYPWCCCALLTVKGNKSFLETKETLQTSTSLSMQHSLPAQKDPCPLNSSLREEFSIKESEKSQVCLPSTSKMLNLNSPDSKSNRHSLQDPVSLNVGGEIYTTTLDTLTRCRDSMLGAMFTGQIPVLRDTQGNIFIDRDGKVFRYILNYLRSSCLDLPNGFSELALLRREADFFQIRPLLQEIRRYEASVPLSLRGGPLGALLIVNVDSKVQYLHPVIVIHFCWIMMQFLILIAGLIGCL